MTTAPLSWPDKDPADVLDYSIDWSAQLALPTEPDTIESVTWTVPSGLTKESQSHAEGIATAWLSGGVSGREYLVACRIVTAGGRTLERSARLLVRDL